MGKKGLIVLGALFVLDIVIAYFFLTDYRPGAVQYWLAVMVVIGQVLVAWRLPTTIFPPRIIDVKKPFMFWLTGFIATVAFFVINWALPEFIPSPPVVIILCLLAVGLAAWLILRMSGNNAAWQDTHKLALASGVLTFFILISFILDLTNETRSDNTAGMAVVGLTAIGLLLWLYWKTKRRLREEQHG